MAQHLLVSMHRWSRTVAPYLGPLRGIARKAFRALLNRRYPGDALVSAEQNGRLWRLRPEVALRGAFQELQTIEWFRSVVKPGMTVLDVGANVGQMTLELAELVGPRGRVLSIEPGAGNLEVLEIHVRANEMQDRVEVVAAACAETHGGEVEFFVAGENASSVGSGHSLAGPDAIHRGTPDIAVHSVRCPRVSIDGLCSERGIAPAMIKIDVEGAELKVLAGALGTLTKARPLLRIGFHPFAFDDALAASDELRRLLSEAGYRIEHSPATGALALEDYVAVPAPAPASRRNP